MLTFQSTLSVRRATNEKIVAHYALRISIHALREESDTGVLLGYLTRQISIHALREESDIRRAKFAVDAFISIHALREESDSRSSSICDAISYFNPRSP